MKFTAIYVRVSTDTQAEKGHSIPEQLDRLKAFCTAKNFNNVKEYIDAGHSGSNMQRPALQNLITDIQYNRVDKVIVYKLDRLSRSQRDAIFMIEELFIPKDITFISMTESFDTSTPLGRAMVGILSVFAQLERENINERMQMGRIARAKSGKWRGGDHEPTGYKYNPVTEKLEILPEEAEIVQLIFSRFLEGKSYTSISREIREKGMKARVANFKQTSAIVGILKNSCYIGTYHYGEVSVPNAHEPIISEDIFYKAQERIKIISDGTRNRGFKAENLLTGILYCKDCGARWRASQNYNPQYNKRYYYYSCYTKDSSVERMRRGCKCTSKPVNRAELDNFIIEKIQELKLGDMRPESAKATKRNYTVEINKLKKQQAKLIDLYIQDKLPMEALDIKNEELQNKINNLEEMRLQEAQKAINKAQYIDNLTIARDTLQNGSMEQKRAVIQSLIKRIDILNKNDIEITWNF